MLSLGINYFTPCTRCFARCRLLSGSVRCSGPGQVRAYLHVHSQRASKSTSNKMSFSQLSSIRLPVSSATQANSFLVRLSQYRNPQVTCFHNVYNSTLSEPIESNATSTDSVSLDKDVNILRKSSSQKSDAQSSVNTAKKAKTQQVDKVAWKLPEGLDTGIKLYNSLTRKKEPFILPSGRLATWYACGPTVYDHAHIGHASSYVRMDVIRRILMNFFNIDVVMVMGVTDIDDKIIQKSKEVNMNFQRVSKYYEDEFFKDMNTMKILTPTVKLRVTEHIPHIIHFIERIMANGCGYKTPDGSVYFDVKKYGRYGKMYAAASEHTDISQGRVVSAQSRVAGEHVDTKKDPRDFALWKAAKIGEPFWNSPWGRGRPGWHIECSTMASSVFGSKLDIHSGGDDLKFPHHENEMAQSEACFCSEQWTNYWVHTGFLHQKNEDAKMSKSLKNTVRVSELLQQYTPNQFRVFCMLRPYRQLVEYSQESMLKAVRIHTQWATFLSTAESYISGQIMCKPINDAHLLASLEETKKKIELALADDFDTAKAIQAVDELIRKTNVELAQRVSSESECSARSPGVVAAVSAYVERIMYLFGIEVSNTKKISESKAGQKFKSILDGVMKFRSEVRNYALNPDAFHTTPELPTGELSEKQLKRVQKQKTQPLLKACDDLRDDLQLSGIKVKDHTKQSSWELVEEVTSSKKLTKKEEEIQKLVQSETEKMGQN